MNDIQVVAKKREEVIDAIRKFFKDQNFREVFTPILVPTPSCEPNLEVFETQLRDLNKNKKRAFLIMSPEYSIKKLLAVGMGSCFEITKCFRNEEEISPLHNSEFTMIEWYRVGADYTAVMSDCENIFTKILGTTMRYQGLDYDLSLPWPRYTVAELFKTNNPPQEDFYKIFFNNIEPELKASRRPAIICDYPLYAASLARRKKENPNVAERFEIFLAGVELGNCFTELTDSVEQRKRFEAEMIERKQNHKTEYPIDESFLKALETIPPLISGIAVGIDRLIMLAMDVPTIAETMCLPPDDLWNR